MKRIISLLLVFALVAAFACGCGKTQDEPSAPVSQETVGAMESETEALDMPAEQVTAPAQVDDETGPTQQTRPVTQPESQEETKPSAVEIPEEPTVSDKNVTSWG